MTDGQSASARQLMVKLWGLIRSKVSQMGHNELALLFGRNPFFCPIPVVLLVLDSGPRTLPARPLLIRARFSAGAGLELNQEARSHDCDLGDHSGHTGTQHSVDNDSDHSRFPFLRLLRPAPYLDAKVTSDRKWTRFSSLCGSCATRHTVSGHRAHLFRFWRAS